MLGECGEQGVGGAGDAAGLGFMDVGDSSCAGGRVDGEWGTGVLEVRDTACCIACLDAGDSDGVGMQGTTNGWLERGWGVRYAAGLYSKGVGDPTCARK